MRYCLFFLCFFMQSAWAELLTDKPEIKAFISQYSQVHNIDEDTLLQLFAKAQLRQDIIEKMQKPAEKTLTWGQYRKIFLEPTRLQQGLDFWQKNQALIKKVSDLYQVDAEIIVAILGIETRYGRVVGKDKVLDALFTLGFFYPPRGEFFKGQLEQFLLLSHEQGFDAGKIKGSYAGAMGPAQFIASSYRAYAVDGDGDKKVDILNNTADIVASVANYFARHHWQKSELVALALKTQTIDKKWLANMPFVAKPSISIGQYRKAGIVIPSQIDDKALANIVPLETDQGVQYWLCFENFYVISRYNRSYLYSMAVYQFSQLLRLHKGML